MSRPVHVHPVRPAPGRLPPGQVVVAIGDIHGQAGLLETLLAELAPRLADTDRAEVVFLGDLVDRGPDSAAVLDRVAAACAEGIEGATVHALMGNHEQMLRRALENRPGAWELFLMNGGLPTLDSLEVVAESAPAAAARMAEAMAGPRRRLLEETLKSHHPAGDYLCVHAGIDPDRALADHLARPWDEMDERHWAWIRYPFLKHRGSFEAGMIVVHGHTPAATPEITANRLGLDTGAAYGGPLSAVWLKADRLRVIQALP